MISTFVKAIFNIRYDTFRNMYYIFLKSRFLFLTMERSDSNIELEQNTSIPAHLYFNISYILKSNNSNIFENIINI